MTFFEVECRKKRVSRLKDMHKRKLYLTYGMVLWFDFRLKSLFISEMIRDRFMVTMER